MAFYIFCIFLYEIEKEIDYKKYIPNYLFFPQEVLLFIIGDIIGDIYFVTKNIKINFNCKLKNILII